MCFLRQKYLQPLKSPECSGLVEAPLVDEIFYQVSRLSHVNDSKVMVQP